MDPLTNHEPWNVPTYVPDVVVWIHRCQKRPMWIKRDLQKRPIQTQRDPQKKLDVVISDTLAHLASKETYANQKRPTKETYPNEQKPRAVIFDTLAQLAKVVLAPWIHKCQKRPIWIKRDLQKRPIQMKRDPQKRPHVVVFDAVTQLAKVVAAPWINIARICRHHHKVCAYWHKRRLRTLI